MKVQLYVYDLSGGIARSMSGALLGVQIDAIYHTSIVMNSLEYVYDSGLKVVHPGSTHLGQPMQIIELGTTGLPIDVVMEYLDSMKDIYTAEVCVLWNSGKPVIIWELTMLGIRSLVPQLQQLLQRLCNIPPRQRHTRPYHKSSPDCA